MMFLSTTIIFEVDFVNATPFISVIVTLKPSSKVIGGTTIQKAVAVSNVVPILTPSSQFRVIVPVASSAVMVVGSPLYEGVIVAAPAIFSLLFPVNVIDLTVTSSPYNCSLR
jgi:ABC-type methionine transport system permease subunit